MKKNRRPIAIAVGFALAALACAGTGPGDRGTGTRPRPHGKIGHLRFIDVHNHLLIHYGPPSSGQMDTEGAARVALAEMERAGMSRMIILPPPFSPDHPGRYTYEALLPAVRNYPDRFSFMGGGGTLNPLIQQAVRDGTVTSALRAKFEKTAAAILAQGGVGFGEITAEHLSFDPQHPYEWAPPDHPLFLLLSDIAGRHGVVIDLHMEAVPEDMELPKRRRLQSPNNPRLLRENIRGLERLLAHNRTAKIIWAHAGWCNTGRRTASLTAQLLERHSNLYMSFKLRPDSLEETRPLTEDRRMKPEWLDLIRAYPDRFLIGSDRFFSTPKGQGRSGGPREGPGAERLLPLLPPELAQKVGVENAVRTFKLSG